MYMHLFYVLGNASTAAGNWGDYKCDVPYQTLENLMEFLGNMSDEVQAEIKGHCSKIAWHGGLISVPVWLGVLDWGPATSQCMEPVQRKPGNESFQMVASIAHSSSTKNIPVSFLFSSSNDNNDSYTS